MEYRLAGRSLGAAVSQRPLSVLGKRAVAGENSERYRALWLDSLLPVIEAAQLETVDVATRPRVGGRIGLYSHPPATVRTMPRWSSPPEMTTPVSPAIFCIPPIQFAHPQWNSAFCGDPRQAEVSRREMMAWGQAIMLKWFTGHFAGPSCGWLEKDKQGDYRWREAGQQGCR